MFNLINNSNSQIEHHSKKDCKYLILLAVHITKKYVVNLYWLNVCVDSAFNFKYNGVKHQKFY